MIEAMHIIEQGCNGQILHYKEDTAEICRVKLNDI